MKKEYTVFITHVNHYQVYERKGSSSKKIADAVVSLDDERITLYPVKGCKKKEGFLSNLVKEAHFSLRELQESSKRLQESLKRLKDVQEKLKELQEDLKDFQENKAK